MLVHTRLACFVLACAHAEDFIGSLVNLTLYPIAEPVSLAALADKSRQALEETGIASFPGFLTSEALELAVEEAVKSSASSAWITYRKHNAWQTEHNSSLPNAHVSNLFMRTRVASVAYDHIGPTLRSLYEAPELLAFVSQLLGQRMYRLADPLGACSITVFRDGCACPAVHPPSTRAPRGSQAHASWLTRHLARMLLRSSGEHSYHFDEAEYTVTLSLQQADEGGDFVYTPSIRTDAVDLASAQVASILRAQTDFSFELPPTEATDADETCVAPIPVRTAPFAPGTLQIFAGRYSLHAVKLMHGPRERLVAVLCFATAPGVRNSLAVQEMFWGRRIPEPLPEAECAR